MTRIEFLKKIFLMYQKCFDKSNAHIWADAYTQVLPDGTDFDKLFHKVLITHDSIDKAPTPKFLHDLIKPYNPRG